jgi:hypothetical protein
VHNVPDTPAPVTTREWWCPQCDETVEWVGKHNSMPCSIKGQLIVVEVYGLSCGHLGAELL